MIILPAIDIKDGKCVRLYKGDFSTAEQVAEDPVETALGFRQAGADWLHMVDLDGSIEKKPVNNEIIIRLARESGLRIELGGGIRDMETIEYYLNNGVERVILGSAALKNPKLVSSAVERFGDRIIVGIDARNKRVATEGWLDFSDVYYTDLAKSMVEIGVAHIIFTDISRDGTLNGPNFDQLIELKSAVSCNIIASGGINNIDDIIGLKELGLYGAICGKSLYKGTLDLKSAIQAVEGI